MQVELTDIASRTAMLTLAGPAAADVLTALGADDAAAMQSGQHTLLQAGFSPIVVAATRTLGERDFTLIVDEAVAGDLWKSLTAKVLEQPDRQAVVLDHADASVSAFDAAAAAAAVQPTPRPAVQMLHRER